MVPKLEDWVYQNWVCSRFYFINYLSDVFYFILYKIKLKRSPLYLTHSPGAEIKTCGMLNVSTLICISKMVNVGLCYPLSVLAWFNTE